MAECTDENTNLCWEDSEADRLYQIYERVQSGEQSALSELFKTAACRQISRSDEIHREYRLSHMDNVLDTELVLDSEKGRQEKEWLHSMDEKVIFQFSCLNKMLYKKKKYFLSLAKNTDCGKGKKAERGGCSKFYGGSYDISDLNGLMYETVIEIFSGKTDENNCLTLDGKRNVKTPIADGVSLLKNISYYTSRRINQRARGRYLDISDTDCFDRNGDRGFSYLDRYEYERFSEAKGGSRRLAMYAEILEWLRGNDACKLFKSNACGIKAIVEAIANCGDTFLPDRTGDIMEGFGMRFVTQKTLGEMIKERYHINIPQEKISRDMEAIEQRLLDHLLYSLNYRIGRAGKSAGIYEKESERFLYELNQKSYVEIFGRTARTLYDESVRFIHGDTDDMKGKRFLRIVRKHRKRVTKIVSLEKGKKKYDMVNMISEQDNDLVEDKEEALLNIANKLTEHYQKEESDFQDSKLRRYRLYGFADWENGYWEVELSARALKIKLFSSEKVRKPIQHSVSREYLTVYRGCVNMFFCDGEKNLCYRFPRNRRVISRADRNHGILMYKVS